MILSLIHPGDYCRINSDYSRRKRPFPATNCSRFQRL